jgi:hypothetical protein
MYVAEENLRRWMGKENPKVFFLLENEKKKKNN